MRDRFQKTNAHQSVAERDDLTEKNFILQSLNHEGFRRVLSRRMITKDRSEMDIDFSFVGPETFPSSFDQKQF